MEAMETKSSKAGVKLCVRFGEWLVNKGLLTHRKLSEALGEQRRSGGRLGEVLLRLKIVTHKDITHALAEYLTIDYVCLDDLSSVDMSIARSVPEAIAKRFFLVAIGESEGKVVVAMCDPLNESTTLYSALNYLNDPHKNITTVEDPVEYRLEGINQIQVKSEINLDFALCLRSILRQDPDIILIGKIRVFEFLIFDKDIRERIIAGASEAEIRAMARRKGYGGLLDGGVKRLLEGLTTAEEVLSVTFAEDINA